MENNEKIFIPYGIKIEKEYIVGFGKKELRRFLKAVLITVLSAILAYVITQNPFTVIVILVTGVLSSFTICRREGYSQSMIDIIKSILDYRCTTQNYDYIYRNPLLGLYDASSKSEEQGEEKEKENE